MTQSVKTKPTSALPVISLQTARRLAVLKQGLANPSPPTDEKAILALIRELGCLQLDPISVVERTQKLVLWSRLGEYDFKHVENLLYQSRHLFEHWAHCASIVLTEEYPVFHSMMRHYTQDETAWHQSSRDWMAQHSELKIKIVRLLAERAPLMSTEIEDDTETRWHTRWSSGRAVPRMLHYLWMEGRIMVAGRKGIQKQWALTEDWLPDWTPREDWSPHEITRFAARKSIRALGVCTQSHIIRHYIRSRYQNLAGVLKEMKASGEAVPVKLQSEAGLLPGEWLIAAEDMPLVEKLESGDWQPRVTLLSPFDNLICDRMRLRSLFNFDYTIEIYTPKEKRRYGYYVMPVLSGETLIGRIDPLVDRRAKTLKLLGVHSETDQPLNESEARDLRASLESLARFVGAQNIQLESVVPEGWKSAFKEL